MATLVKSQYTYVRKLSQYLPGVLGYQKPKKVKAKIISAERMLDREKGPIGKKNKKISTNMPRPLLPNAKYAAAVRSGSKSAKSFEPSSGGIGIRFKTARRRFHLMIVVKRNPAIPLAAIWLNPKPGKRRWVRIVAMIARIILVNGPASETKAKSFIPSRRLKGSTGTGLAPPKINVPPDPKYVIRGMRRLMKGSMCEIGLRVIRPNILAVGSPSRYAT
jgi:hypothetical protein